MKKIILALFIVFSLSSCGFIMDMATYDAIYYRPYRYYTQPRVINPYYRTYPQFRNPRSHFKHY